MKSSIMTNVGQAVKRLRVARRWSQETLAEKSGITPLTVLRIEHGYNTPSLDTLAKLARAFKVTIDALIVMCVRRVGQQEIKRILAMYRYHGGNKR